jgi:hypothetical protein
MLMAILRSGDVKPSPDRGAICAERADMIKLNVAQKVAAVSGGKAEDGLREVETLRAGVKAKRIVLRVSSVGVTG